MATFLSNYLSLKTSDSSLGRYWIANEDIPSGTLLIKESPFVSIPNCQINEEQQVKDPIHHKANSLCWNCCRLFGSDDNHNHYCSVQCKQSNNIINIILNPSFSFNKSIANDLTLRLTVFMLLKMLYYYIEHNKTSLLSNLHQTFKEYKETPSAFYEIFTANTKQHRLLQYSIDNSMDSNTLYQSYLNKLSDIIESLMDELSFDLNKKNVHTLSVYILNMIFINSFGIGYSLIHDEDMLGLSLYYNASLLNHSCCPNALYHFVNGNCIIIRTIRDIKANESITISIIDDMESYAKQERECMILSHFGFKCLCIRCCDEEYLNNDALLSERVNDIESIINNKAHKTLLKLARSNYKFYCRLFDEYRYYYHPFDVGILSLLQEISQKAFMIKDYKIGFDAAELGQQFALRLTSSNIVGNCYLKEFKFIVLSFINYLYLIEDKYPLNQIGNINNNNDNKDIVVMNDDILAKVFEDESMVNIEDGVDFVNNNVDADIDGMNAMDEMDIKWSEFEENIDIIKGKESVKKKVNNRNKNKRYKKNNKYRKRKQKGNTSKRKQKGYHKGKKGKYKNKKGNKSILFVDDNVKVFTFGNNEYKCNDDEIQNTLEYELNERIIALCATRSILFPKFQDFEQWLGTDLMTLDPRIQYIVTLLKDKFDQNV